VKFWEAQEIPEELLYRVFNGAAKLDDKINRPNDDYSILPSVETWTLEDGRQQILCIYELERAQEFVRREHAPVGAQEKALLEAFEGLSDDSV
jgi:hypothetical protein